MREVQLAPEHSSWWILSPGVILYYDKLKIYRSDYEKIIRDADQSSYHEQIALQLESYISREEFPEIEITDDFSTVKRGSFYKHVADVNDDLIARARSTDDPTLTCEDLIELTYDALSHWINYNERKAKFLERSEPLRTRLEAEELPAWRERLRKLRNLAEADSSEMLDMLLADNESMSTFSRLVAAGCRCRLMTEEGRHIHDPMLDQYMPMVKVLVGRAVSEYAFNAGKDMQQFSHLFESSIKTYSKRYRPPSNETSLIRSVRRCKELRKRLSRLDETIRSISDEDLRDSVAEAEREVAALMAHAGISATAVANGAWMSALVWSLGSFVPPVITDAARGGAEAATLMAKGVGRFAGAYAIVADRMLVSQDTLRSASKSYRVDSGRWTNHYKNFAHRVSS